MPLAIHFLFWATLICLSLVLYHDRDLRLLLQKHWWIICFLILIAFLWRLPHAGQFFYGLEYEDAYVYTVSGRYLSEGIVFSNTGRSPYLTTVCAVGSWETCRISDTFSGHLVGYPYLIASLSSLLGFRQELGVLVSLFASLLTIVPVFLIGRMLDTDGIAGEAGAVLYSITPLFAVHGVGAYAEPTSNLLVLFSLHFFMRMLVLNKGKASPPVVANWLAFTCTALLALLVKRENFLLFPVLASFGSLLPIMDRSYTTTRMKIYRLMLAASACLGLALALELDLPSMVESEGFEFGIFPFNWRTFQTMFPLFVQSFTIPGWYLLGFPFVMIGAASWIQARRYAIFPTALFVSYLLLYSSHVRSYYQLQAGGGTMFDTIRYSMNLTGLWSILAGVGFSLLVSLATVRLGVHRPRRFASALFLATIAGLAVLGYLNTDTLKKEMVSNEFRVRIEPAQAAISYARESGVSETFVITLEPLLVHMLAAEPINIIDFRYLDAELLRDLQRESPNTVFLYLEGKVYLSEADKERYARGFAVLESTRRIKLLEGEEFSLYWLELSRLN